MKKSNNFKWSFESLGKTQRNIYWTACAPLLQSLHLALVWSLNTWFICQLQVSKSSIRRHFTISQAQRKPTNLLSNSKANTEESVQTVSRLLFTVPIRGFPLGKRLVLHFLGIFINNEGYLCKRMQMLGFYLSDWKQRK